MSEDIPDLDNWNNFCLHHSIFTIDTSSSSRIEIIIDIHYSLDKNTYIISLGEIEI